MRAFLPRSRHGAGARDDRLRLIDVRDLGAWSALPARHVRVPDGHYGPVAPGDPSLARLSPRIDCQCISLESEVVAH
jgi:hypothetical protein